MTQDREDVGISDRHTRTALLAGILSTFALVTAVFAPVTPAQARYAAIVIEADTGRVLHAVNADTRNYPASLTKMMTLYLLFERIEQKRLGLGDRMRVSRRAANRVPSKLGLRKGERIVVRDAIGTLVTKSANDAATVVAEAIGGNERRFARMMTAKARELGMSRTNFRNASGLPDRRQTSTARDMARLANALLRTFPRQYPYFKMRTYHYDGTNYRNHNRLLRSFQGMDGIKTGYTAASGFNIASSAKRDGKRLIAVVFGGKSARWRDRHVARLLSRGFAALEKSKHGVRVIRGGGRPIPVPKAKPIRRVADNKTRWSIEVGRFHQFALAHRAITSAADIVPSLVSTPVAILSDEGKGGLTVFRPQIMGLSEASARRSCNLLLRMKFKCQPVPNYGGTMDQGSR